LLGEDPGEGGDMHDALAAAVFFHALSPLDQVFANYLP
jgi:hypothetical protein